MTSAEEMQDRLRLYSQVKLLILDDIGRERSKDLESDRVTAVLDGVVSARDRAGLPTLWTSNLRDDDLAVAYGESFHRRLVRANPAVILPDTAPLFT